MRSIHSSEWSGMNIVILAYLHLYLNAKSDMHLSKIDYGRAWSCLITWIDVTSSTPDYESMSVLLCPTEAATRKGRLSHKKPRLGYVCRRDALTKVLDDEFMSLIKTFAGDGTDNRRGRRLHQSCATMALYIAVWNVVYLECFFEQAVLKSKSKGHSTRSREPLTRTSSLPVMVLYELMKYLNYMWQCLWCSFGRMRFWLS